MMTKYEVKSQELFTTPVPKQTRTYKPVSHEELINLTLNSIYQAGFKLEKESYSWAREGKVANGRYTIKDVSDTEMQLQIGWQNSYDRSLSLKFAMGTQIYICKNGSVSGDYGSLKKAHKGNIQEFTPMAISSYIKKAGEGFRRMQNQREAMKQIEINKTVTAELIGRMYLEHELITSTQLNIIKKELKEPTFNYESKGSMWELYNFVTYSLKEEHPSNWMQSHINAHNFFLDNSNIESQPTIIDIQPLNQLELFNE